jgi:ribose 5-phosphate isomerase A
MSTETGSERHRSSEDLRQDAAGAAAALLEDGMIVGLGSGSTARMAITAIGRLVREGLKITGIPTSEQTAELARSLDIPLSTLGDHSQVDLTIDGADEVELGTLNLIKGGGGNQLREKIVATASSRLVIVVDEAKLVARLGTHAKVPVEVAQFGWQATARNLAQKNARPELRLWSDGTPFLTDGGNYILDCDFGFIEGAASLQRELDSVVGVVEHGLFIGLASQVIAGTREGVRVLVSGA